MKHNHEDTIAALAEAGRALTKVVSPAGAKQIYEAIEAQRASAARDRLPKNLRNVLAEMSVRAARRIGELLAESRLSRGGRPRKGARVPRRRTLAALRLTKNQSSRWQGLASLPEDLFEAQLKEAMNRAQAPSVSSLLKLAKALRATNRRLSRGAVSSPAISAHILAHEGEGRLGDLKDHLSHLGDMVQSRESAATAKHAQAVDRRMIAVLREMRDIVESIQRGR